MNRSALLPVVAALLMLCTDASAQVSCWLETSLRRVYPKTAPPPSPVELNIPAARNGRFAFQVAVRNGAGRRLSVKCAATPDGSDLNVQIRRVGYVPMRHLTIETDFADLEGVEHSPGLVPDPLFVEDSTVLGPLETKSFWLTVTVSSDAKPGARKIDVTIDADDKSTHKLSATLDVSQLVIQPRKDFPVTHWWRAEAIWDHYKTGMWEDERLWTLMEAYLRNYVEHGNDVVFVPLFFMRREPFKRPAQLLTVTSPSPGKYEFDWTQTRRFIDLARKCGIQRFEWPHLWIYWGVENPIRVYTWENGQARMLWSPDEKATGETYLTFLRQFLPAYHEFLKSNDLLDKSFFHLSDEPGGDQHVRNYEKARQVLRELAPWMKVMDALSDIEYGRKGLTDIPIPIVSSAQRYIDEGIPHWVYYCCAPRGAWLNRFMDTPLTKIRMSGWIFYKQGARGFLHWGYNYWHRMEREELTDPFAESSGGEWPGIPAGDPFVVYPGKDGPIDSIRWEVFAESLQDYAILQTAGVKPKDAMLSDIKTYAEFPRSADWIDKRLRAALAAKP
jgi:hypothetical protein